VRINKAYGFVTPILVDQEKRVIDGWAVVMAAKKLGLSKIPVVCNLDLSDVELRALKIALNKISELSSWDDADLRESGQFRSPETDRQFAKARHWRAFLALLGINSPGVRLPG
jgi:hypothetical protein